MRKLVLTLLTSAISASLNSDFRKFKSKYNIKYDTAEENSYRRGVFKINSQFVKYHNLLFGNGEVSFKLKLNEFAAHTNNEFANMFGFGGNDNYPNNKPIQKFNCNSTIRNPLSSWNGKSTPASYNWQNHNAVTNIKNQGQCGACWSFSAAGAIEGAWAIKTGQLQSVSEQQMLDCSSNQYVKSAYYNEGCNGGFQQNALLYVMNAGGVESYDEYSYVDWVLENLKRVDFLFELFLEFRLIFLTQSIPELKVGAIIMLIKRWLLSNLVRKFKRAMKI